MTIETTTPWTLQTAYDAIIARMYDGKGQASYAGNCTYWHEKKRIKCAVGALLNDYDAASAQEQLLNVQELLNRKHGYFDQTIDGYTWKTFLSNAQSIHDAHDNWEGGKFTAPGLLRRLGEDNGLIVPEALYA